MDYSNDITDDQSRIDAIAKRLCQAAGNDPERIVVQVGAYEMVFTPTGPVYISPQHSGHPLWVCWRYAAEAAISAIEAVKAEAA